MGYLVLPLIIGVIALPQPGPSKDALADFARIQKALDKEVYVRDASGQERVVRILDAATDAITVEVGRQQVTMLRDDVLAVDRRKDRNIDGIVKGAVVGLILGAVIESAYTDANGRYLLRGAVSYGVIGYLFDHGHTAREPLYRAP